MKSVRLQRSLAVVTVAGWLAAALTANAGAAPQVSAKEPNVQSEPASPKDSGLIADCLNNPNVPADTLVTGLERAPGDVISLLCGNEAFGARHIHADHPINNSNTFEGCWLTTIAQNQTRPGNDPDGSTEWHYPYAPGKEAVVVTANTERDTLTAYTTGPNSADWDGCAQ